MAEFTPGQLYDADPNDSTKQTAPNIPHPNVSHVAAMTSAERTALADKAIGTMVFDTGDNQLYIWNGASWVDISTP